MPRRDAPDSAPRISIRSPLCPAYPGGGPRPACRRKSRHRSRPVPCAHVSLAGAPATSSRRSSPLPAPARLNRTVDILYETICPSQKIRNSVTQGRERDWRWHFSAHFVSHKRHQKLIQSTTYRSRFLSHPYAIHAGAGRGSRADRRADAPARFAGNPGAAGLGRVVSTASAVLVRADARTATVATQRERLAKKLLTRRDRA